MKPNNDPQNDGLVDKKVEIIDATGIVEDKKEEVTAVSCDLWKQVVYELIGTFMFMLVIYFCKGDVTKFVFGFWVILCIFGGYSGAHVNPAITLGFYVYEKNLILGLPKLFLYWVAQFAGSIAGAFLSKRFFTAAVYVVPTNQSVGDVMYTEFFFTGTFLFVILWVCSKHTSPSPYGPLNCGVIVCWFYVIVHAGSSVSGAAYNPAILSVLNFIAYESTDPKALGYIGYMISAELIGVVIFALIFSWFFEPFIKAKNEKSVKECAAEKI